MKGLHWFFLGALCVSVFVAFANAFAQVAPSTSAVAQVYNILDQRSKYNYCLMRDKYGSYLSYTEYVDCQTLKHIQSSTINYPYVKQVP